MDMIFIMRSIGILLLMAIALPLVMQKIKPDHLYGVRSAFTLTNETAWNQANRFWGMALLPAILTMGKLRGLKKE